jgi:hypothetical protein
VPEINYLIVVSIVSLFVYSEGVKCNLTKLFINILKKAMNPHTIWLSKKGFANSKRKERLLPRLKKYNWMTGARN